MGKSWNYDLDLAFGEKYEEALKVLLQDMSKIEVKTERDIWATTGNIAIEVACNGQPSGLKTTRAEWWCQILTVKGVMMGIFMIPVIELKKRIAALDKESPLPRKKGGDSGKSELILVPIKRIF